MSDFEKSWLTLMIFTSILVGIIKSFKLGVIVFVSWVIFNKVIALIGQHLEETKDKDKEK